jgi:hypothetical protein
MGILEKEVAGDFKREKEVDEGYKNRSSLSLEERLRLMWREDIYGRLSPELTAVSQSSAMALFIGEKVFLLYTLQMTICSTY